MAATMSKKSLIKKPGRAVWSWLAVGAAVLLLALLLHSTTFTDYMEEALDWAENVMDAHPVIGAVVFFLASALSAILAFASSTVLVPPANLVWGKPITFLLLWSGWMVGAMAAYGIGHLARPLLVRLGFGEKLEEYQRFVSKKMKFWAVLLICLAVPSEIPGYLFGGAHYPFWKFLGAMAIAEAIYAFGLVIAAESVVEAEPLPLLAIFAVLIVIAVGAGLLLRVIKRRKSGGMPSRSK
jgi:uncharacterized membrane protein YdjX (TVP38/TMEM64 family)